MYALAYDHNMAKLLYLILAALAIGANIGMAREDKSKVPLEEKAVQTLQDLLTVSSKAIMTLSSPTTSMVKLAALIHGYTSHNLKEHLLEGECWKIK